MHKPSRRWVSIKEFDSLTSGLPRKHLCRLLRRCDRTIRDWQSGRRPIPAWTTDTLRMYQLETVKAYREMFGRTPTEEWLAEGRSSGHVTTDSSVIA